MRAARHAARDATRDLLLAEHRVDQVVAHRAAPHRSTPGLPVLAACRQRWQPANVCMQARSCPCVDAARACARHGRRCAGVCVDADPPNTARASSGVGARPASAAGRRFSRAISFFAARRAQTLRRSDRCVITTAGGTDSATVLLLRIEPTAADRRGALRSVVCTVSVGREIANGQIQYALPESKSTAAVRAWDVLRPHRRVLWRGNHSTSPRRTGEDEVGVVVVRGSALDGLMLRDREVLDDVPAH